MSQHKKDFDHSVTATGSEDHVLKVVQPQRREDVHFSAALPTRIGQALVWERVGEVDESQRIPGLIVFVDDEVVSVVVSQGPMRPPALVEGTDKLEPLRARKNQGVSAQTIPTQEEVERTRTACGPLGPSHCTTAGRGTPPRRRRRSRGGSRTYTG